MKVFIYNRFPGFNVKILYDNFCIIFQIGVARVWNSVKYEDKIRWQYGV